MRPLRAFSSPARVLLLLLFAVLVSGCAGRSPRMQEPIEPKRSDAPLPGSTRELPSEQNRGLAPRDAPRAFATPETGRVVPRSQEGEVADPRGEADTVSREASTESAVESVPEPSVPEPSAPVRPGTVLGTIRPSPARPTPVPEVSIEAGERYFTVQLLVMSAADAAADWKSVATRRLGDSVRIDHEGDLYKIRVGRTTRIELAEQVRRQAIVAGFEDAFLVELEATGSQ